MSRTYVNINPKRKHWDLCIVYFVKYKIYNKLRIF